MYVPGRFMHWALVAHSNVFSAHSSISEEKVKKIQRRPFQYHCIKRKIFTIASMMLSILYSNQITEQQSGRG